MIKPSRNYDFPVVRDGIQPRNGDGVQPRNGDGAAPRNGDGVTERQRKPDWLRVSLPSGVGYSNIKEIVSRHNLATVCQEAMCPNIAECWAAGTATFMLMGSVCTRACKFCAVNTGNPAGWLDATEPAHIAEGVELMNLKYVVLTSVNRDDLADGGAKHFANTVRAIKSRNPDVKVEALTPDFAGRLESVEEVVLSGVEVYAQNLETVRRLTHPVRDPRAGYEQTLKVLAHARTVKNVFTKSSLMLGLGETRQELRQAMQDLRGAGVDVVTFGQYLQPTRNHLPVVRFVSPEEFDDVRDEAFEFGFMEVVAGPLVRSSYKAEQVLKEKP